MADDGFVRGANRGNNVFLHLFALALMVTGPIVYAANDGGTVGIVLTVVLLPLGIAVWRGIARQAAARARCPGQGWSQRLNQARVRRRTSSWWLRSRIEWPSLG